MTKEESINIKDMTDYRCKECKKDWTKCSRCPVNMEWIKEHKISKPDRAGSEVQDADSD